MKQEANAYYTITPESTAREREKLYEKARHDEAQALYHAEQKGKADVARKLLKRNRPIDEIVEDTGLTYEEVEKLRTNM